MRALTICVGISDYPTAVLGPGECSLKYLANSAQDLSHLFSRIWPHGDSKHLVAVDSDATLSTVRKLASTQVGQFDIFVLYLAGHGRAGRGPFEFLFHGDGPREARARAADIDALISSPSASNTLLLLDACYAGQYAVETSFFKVASAGSSRLCIASSMANQKSWEDSHFERSLFADALTKALTTDVKVSGCVKIVPGDFFSEIALDVARHAFGLKGSAAQEPMIFGAASGVLEITTVAADTTHPKSLTTYQTLLRRTRQISVAAVCATTLGIIVISTATWRPAINSFGYVELRAGPKWLSLMNVGPWARRVETDVTRLDIRDADLQAALLNEQGIHVWPGLGSNGSRRWADIFIDDFLANDAAERWRVRLGYADAVEHLTTISHAILPTPIAASPSATELAAEVSLLQPERPLPDVWKLQWKENIARGSCSLEEPASTASDLLEAYLNLSTPAEYKVWLDGLAEAARTDDAIGFDQVADLVRMFTTANVVWNREYRQTIGAPGEPITAERVAARFTERPSISEVIALANVGSAIIARRKAHSVDVVTPDERRQLIALMSGCSDVAVYVLAALGNDGAPHKVIEWAHTRAKSDLGRVALRELATYGALPDAEVSWVLDSAGFSGDATDRRHAFVDTHEWLAAIATHQSLPVPVLVKLLDYAVERRAANDTIGEQQALRLVLGDRAASQPPLSARIASELEHDQAGPPPLNEWQIEKIGLLARSGTALSVEQRNLLELIIKPSSSGETARISYTDEDKGESTGATELVGGSTLAHLIAVSRWVIGGMPHEDTASRLKMREFLETALADAVRFGVDPAKLGEVVTAVAILWQQSSPEGLDANVLYRELECCSDMAARKAHIDIAVAVLQRMPHQLQSKMLDELRGFWRIEQEPEVKLAMAEVIVRAIAGSNWPGSRAAGVLGQDQVPDGTASRMHVGRAK